MRHEEKYICSDRQLRLIEERIRTVMPRDAHQSGEDYGIRSLYFDTADDRFYHEGVNGVDNRRKYRIRFYNMNCEAFRMERKDTVRQLKQKYSAKVGREYVDDVIEGRCAEYDGTDDLLREVYSMECSDGLHPVAVIGYRRSAYTYPVGNVRITFDRDIACTGRTEDMLDPYAVMYPVMPAGRHILEVKYDGILPGFIASVIDTGSLERVSFSKYVYSRDVINGNGRKEDGYEF